MTSMKDFLITLYSWTFFGEMKEDNENEEEMDIVMRIEDEKQESEEIGGKNDENTDLGKALMNSESHNVLDTTYN